MTEPTADTQSAEPSGTMQDDTLDLPENLEAAKKLRSENKNLRERLRALESDYEAAATRLEGMRHAEIERLAAEHLIDPHDIWADLPADSVVDEYGMVNPAKVAEAAKALTASKPHLAKDYNPRPAPPTDRPIEGLRGGATPYDFTPQPQPTWSDAISARVAPRR